MAALAVAAARTGYAPELHVASIAGLTQEIALEPGSRPRVLDQRPWLPIALAGLVGVGLVLWYWWHHSTLDPVQTASTALRNCHDVTAPAVPDATTASLEQMLAARKAFQTYDAGVNAYVLCVDAAVDAVAKQATRARAADLQRLRTYGIDMHNAAIDRETAVVAKFNQQLRLYKVQHPAP